jgi:hypothetical protein
MTSPIRLVSAPSGPLKLPIEPIEMGVAEPDVPTGPPVRAELLVLAEPPELQAVSVQTVAAVRAANNLVTDGLVTERYMRTPRAEV